MSKTKETKKEIETKKIIVLKRFFTEQGEKKNDINDEIDFPVGEDLNVLLKYGYAKLMEE